MKKQLNYMQAWYETKNDQIERTSYSTRVATYNQVSNILWLHTHWNCSRSTGRQVATFCKQILGMPDASVPTLRKALNDCGEINGVRISFDGGF